MNGDYDRDFDDPLQLPPEPIGWWGLSRRSRPWARDEHGWGTSERTREREMGRRGPWRGTGAWGPGQAEPGIWGREPLPRRSRPQRYDRELEGPDPRSRGERGIEWNGWGYEVGRGRGSFPRRPPFDGWGSYHPGGPDLPSGAWDYGRRRQRFLGAESAPAGRGGWRRPRSQQPDLRQGEAWNEVGPGRWARTPPSGRQGWMRGSGPAPYGRDYGDDYGPRRRGRRYDGDYGW